MKITINEKKFSDYCTEARDIYINNLKKAADEKGEKIPKLIEVSELISMIVFCSELRKVIFEHAVSDEETPNKNDDLITVKLDIPESFKINYNRDKFKEILERIRFDISSFYAKYYIYNPSVSGKYEIELLDMLIDSFSDSEIVR